MKTKPQSIYEDRIPCDCGGWKKPAVFKVEGFEVRGWKCQKCGDIEYSDDINKVLTLKRLRQSPIEVKAREVGNTEILTIPREVTQLMSIKRGRRLLIRPKTMRSFEVEVR